MHRIFITGGTGFMGRNLIPELFRRGHEVCALVRPGSEGKLPDGCRAASGDALRDETYASSVPPADTFVQLVGVTHPNPAKGNQFRDVDLVSARAAVAAAVESGVRHFVYVSVAQPAPVMKAYIRVRAEVEELIRASGLAATIVRPWYVLGPGRRWPLLLAPIYWTLERIPATRDSARRLGLVTIEQMVSTLAAAVENPSQGIRVVEVPEIRQSDGHGSF